MSNENELYSRLLADARAYDPAAHHRGLLAPHRDALLLWRAKFMSYEQIAAALTAHGIKVSPAGVGVFCRRAFTKAELERARHEQRQVDLGGESKPRSAAQPQLSSSRTSTRGPKVARDDY